MEPVEYVRGLRRRWRVIVAGMLVGVAAAWLTTEAVPVERGTSPDRYQAEVLLLDARGDQFGSESRGPEGVPLSTMAAFATLNGVSSRAAESLDGDESPEELAATVEAIADEETGILTISADAPTARRAERVAGAFARALRAYLMDQQRRELRVRIRAFQDQLAELDCQGSRSEDSSLCFTLRSQISDLRVELATPVALPILEPPRAEAINEPGITAPTSRGGRLLIGVIAGLLGGIALALVLERFDRRITNWKESDEHLNSPLLAEIPRVRRARALAVVDRPTSRGADAFRLLASTVLQAIKGRAQVGSGGNGHAGHPGSPVVAVTSAIRSEGKSLVAANLAAALGELGLRVIVVSCDLRSPTVHRYFDEQASPGIVDAVGDWDGRPGFERIRRNTRAPGVSIVPAGSSSKNPAAVLAQAGFGSILNYAREEAQIVIVDTPAVLLSGDALPAIKDAEAVLVVARVGKTPVEAADRLREALDRLGAHVIGYALNDAKGVTAGWRQTPYRVARDGKPIRVPDLASTNPEGGR
jgi:Mrp family chromosome partitioning ATPase/capsular polysaccharide biosynthesis protein